MQRITDLIIVADAYRFHLELPVTTVSNRVFSDTKKLGALMAGADIYLSRFNAAMAWFSANWPEGLAWPEGVERPEAATGGEQRPVVAAEPDVPSPRPAPQRGAGALTAEAAP